MSGRRKILVVGHSHMQALAAAPRTDDLFQFEACWEKRDGEWAEKDVSRFAHLGTLDVGLVALAVGGNQHIFLGLANHRVPFDFVLPERPDLGVDPAAQLLPAGLIERCLRRHMAAELIFFSALAALFPRTAICQIETPPPLPDDHVEAYPHVFSGIVRRAGVAPLPHRYKLWRLHSAIWRAHGAAAGVDFVEAPREALDQDGSLRAPYRGGDPTHANSLYGALVLDQLRARAGRGITDFRRG